MCYVRAMLSWTWLWRCYHSRVCIPDALEKLGDSSIPAEAYASLLRQCRAERSLPDGKRVHDHMIKGGYRISSQLGNLLIQMYGKCGDLCSAQAVFDALSEQERKVTSWSLLIAAYTQNGHSKQALALYRAMLRTALLPNDFTISAALSACSSLRDLAEGESIHRWVIQNGFKSNLLVQTALVSMYAKCWNAIISSYAQNGHLQEALDLYRRMIFEDVEPSSVTFATVLSVCASLGAVEAGKMVHSQILLCGLYDSTVVQNGLVNMYAKCGVLHEARAIFDTILYKTVVSWTAIVSAYAIHGYGEEALLLFHEMRRNGVQPNELTFTAALTACSILGDSVRGRAIQVLIEESGIESNTILEDALLNMHARCGDLEQARQIFRRMQQPDVVSWTNMITACTDNGLAALEALALFKQMDLEGLKTTAVTLASVLNACAWSGALSVGKQLHTRIGASGFQSSLLVQTALLDMYSKCGSLENAREIFSNMEARSLVSWTAMIGAYAQHGHGEEAVELFKEMNLEGVEADAITFTCVLRACSHAGLIEEGRLLFRAMAADYNIMPTESHYSRAVDIMARAGRLQDAEDLIHCMPFQPETVTWKALLTACRTHNQAERATRIAETIAKLEPEESMAYTLLGNIYAGLSFIEINNKVHEFAAGDQNHPSYEKIRLELDVLNRRLKEVGYVPNTKDVLHAVNEEEKEQLIGLHSEKLAIVFGLITTPQGTALRIVKNLRVCSDCHAATKFISKTTSRRIVVRDTHRFHHFENGVCSCKDYW